jgi:hypothetical protein
MGSGHADWGVQMIDHFLSAAQIQAAFFSYCRNWSFRCSARAVMSTCSRAGNACFPGAARALRELSAVHEWREQFLPDFVTARAEMQAVRGVEIGLWRPIGPEHRRKRVDVNKL